MEADLACLIEDTQLFFRMTSLLSSLEKFVSLRNWQTEIDKVLGSKEMLLIKLQQLQRIITRCSS